MEEVTAFANPQLRTRRQRIRRHYTKVQYTSQSRLELLTNLLGQPCISGGYMDGPRSYRNGRDLKGPLRLALLVGSDLRSQNRRRLKQKAPQI
jgi:hypothetical protein